MGLALFFLLVPSSGERFRSCAVLPPGSLFRGGVWVLRCSTSWFLLQGRGLGPALFFLQVPCLSAPTESTSTAAVVLRASLESPVRQVGQAAACNVCSLLPAGLVMDKGVHDKPSMGKTAMDNTPC